ncbi:DUF1877 family protein [Streptomyces sp. NPDC127159]|uniref:DUF1877 family protein n=1 Tax=unclassified Streptomyces TaxID=2593676 RepID=UPI0036394312
MAVVRARGYRPARYLTREDVAQVGGFLAATPFDESDGHYNSTAMRSAEIHLLPQSATEVGSDLGNLRHRYEELTRYFSATATAGDAIVLMLT